MQHVLRAVRPFFSSEFTCERIERLLGVETAAPSIGCRFQRHHLTAAAPMAQQSSRHQKVHHGPPPNALCQGTNGETPSWRPSPGRSAGETGPGGGAQGDGRVAARGVQRGCRALRSSRRERADSRAALTPGHARSGVRRRRPTGSNRAAGKGGPTDAPETAGSSPGCPGGQTSQGMAGRVVRGGDGPETHGQFTAS